MAIKEHGEDNTARWIIWTIVVILAFIVSSIGGCMTLWPKYQVYTARMDGQAELAKAYASKQVQVQDAIAKKESAQALADAEVIRAQGVAAANKIVADGLGGPEGYLRYLYIQTLQDTKNQVIYIPTEGALPILEANRETHQQAVRPAPQ